MAYYPIERIRTYTYVSKSDHGPPSDRQDRENNPRTCKYTSTTARRHGSSSVIATVLAVGVFRGDGGRRHCGACSRPRELSTVIILARSPLYYHNKWLFLTLQRYNFQPGAIKFLRLDVKMSFVICKRTVESNFIPTDYIRIQTSSESLSRRKTAILLPMSLL